MAMTKQEKHLTDSLTVLADALQCPLVYKDSDVSGYREATITLAPGLTLPVKVQALKFFIGESVGVLFHVSGSLWLLATYFPKTNAVTVFIIEALNGVPFASAQAELKDVVKILRPSIRVAHTYNRTTKEWSILNLPA